MQIIPLTTEDDIVSTCDRMEWATGDRILFMLPADSDLNDKLDFVRLRRCADYNRIEVGLVTGDRRIKRQAKALGFPIFRDKSQARHDPRRWRRGQRRRELVGLPTKGGRPLSEWRQEHRNPIAPDETAVFTPRQWMFRYVGIFLFFIAAALLVVLFAYAVPGATVTLQPQREAVTARQLITADPALTAVDVANKIAPARRIEITQAWDAEVETTGLAERPTTLAQGSVIFTNRSDETVLVPAETKIRVGNQILFQTIAPVTLPDAEGSTAEAAVIAIQPGPQANVDADSVTGLEDRNLNALLNVENPEPMTGGSMQEITVVAQEDLDHLRAQALQFLQAVALAEMETGLTEREFLARESLQLVDVLEETYSHEVGEQANRVSLRMEAALAGTAVNNLETTGLAYDALATAIPDGYSLDPDSLTFDPGPIIGVDDQGRVTFEMRVNGFATADLAVDEALTAVGGQSPDLAAAYLYNNLPLRDAPTITIWPIWADKMPFWAQRVELIIDN